MKHGSALKPTQMTRLFRIGVTFAALFGLCVATGCQSCQGDSRKDGPKDGPAREPSAAAKMKRTPLTPSAPPNSATATVADEGARATGPTSVPASVTDTGIVVRSRADGPRLVARWKPEIARAWRAKDALVVQRTHAGSSLTHVIRSADDGVEVALPSLGIAYTVRGPACSVAASGGGVKGRCQDDEAATMSALGGLFAASRLADNRADDALIEAVGLDRDDSPHVRLSSRKLGVRWWLHGAPRGATFEGVSVAARGMVARWKRSGSGWSLRIGRRDGGLWATKEDENEAPGGHWAWLKVAMGEGGAGTDPLDVAGQRLAALAAHNNLIAAGPLGLLVTWNDGKADVRGAVLPVIGEPPPAHRGPTTKAATGHSTVVQGHALAAAMARHGAAPGSYIVLVLNVTLDPPPRGVIALLPVSSEHAP